MFLRMNKEAVQQRAIDRGVDAISQASGQKNAPEGSDVAADRISWLDRWLVKALLDGVGNPPLRIMLWNDLEASPACRNPVATLHFSDRPALFKTLLDHELHWGDLYCSGRVRLEGDMARLIEVIARAIQQKGHAGYVKRFIQWLAHRQIVNSQEKARENIHHHYDIGNDFYRLWLDRERMQYSCAYFPHEDMTLEQAQLVKLQHICRKLQLKPGDRVIEAGCGWGGLAHFMARHFDVKVTAYNISQQQIDYARQRAEKDGLTDQLQYVQDDYRNIQGQCDVFVSVGMLEHVALADYELLGQVIDRCLTPDGRGLIHSIGRVSPKPMNPWIERHIFPGAYPPSLSEMMLIFEPNQLAVQDVENLRLHYSKTLQLWAQRFEQHRPTIVEMMDEEFARACTCMALSRRLTWVSYSCFRWFLIVCKAIDCHAPAIICIKICIKPI